MKKKVLSLILVATLIFSVMLIAACDSTPKNQPIELSDEDKVNTTLDKPEGQTPNDVSATDALFIAQGELKRSGGFKSKATGATTSFAGIKQNISSERVVVGNNVFKQSVSCSTFVKQAIQHYVYGENYLARNASKVSSLTDVQWESSAIKYTKDGWNNKVGYRAVSMTGYILNYDTVLSGTLESAEDGLYTFRYVLDTEKSTAQLLYEMRDNAGSNDFAVFSKAEIVVTMDENFIVQTLVTDCEYKASAAGLSNVSCKEQLTETFYDIGYNGDLPDCEFFATFFDAETTDSDTEKEVTATDVLIGMFGDYITGGETLSVSAEIKQADASLTSAEVALTLDAEDLTNIAFDAKWNDLILSYAGGKILTDFQDFRGSATVVGLAQFLGTFSTDVDIDSVDFGDIDFDSITENMTFEVKNGKARVHLPLEISTLTAKADFYANVIEDNAETTYEFYKAEVSIGTLKVVLTPSDWTAPDRGDAEYPNISGLTDLIDNGKITLKTELLNTPVSVMTDTSTGSFCAQTEGKNASVCFADNTLYVTFGKAKVKFAVADIDEALGYLSEILHTDISMSGTNLDISSVLTMLGQITATEEDGKTVFSAESEEYGVALKVVLSSQDGEWLFENITVSFGDEELSFVSADSFDMPTIKADSYIDITSVIGDYTTIAALTAADKIQLDFDANCSAIGNIDGSAILNITETADGETSADFSLNAKLSDDDAEIISGSVVLKDGIIYIAISDGVKVAVDLNDISSVDGLPNEVTGALSEKLAELQDNLSDITLEKLAYDVSGLTYSDGSLTLELRGLLTGSPAEITLSAGADGSLELSVDKLNFDGITASATISAAVTDQVVETPTETYVMLNDVANDFAPSVEALSEAKFLKVLVGDCRIDILDNQDVADSYQIAADSYVEFYIGESVEESLLRANVKVNHLESDAWADFITMDLALIDGRIYLTYNNDLKVSISIEAIRNCTDLSEELKNAVPQLAELLESAQDVSEDVDLSNVNWAQLVKSLTYEEGSLSLTVDGSAIDEKLGDITLIVSTDGNSITLTMLQLSYDNVTVTLNNISIAPSATIETSDEDSDSTASDSENTETESDENTEENVESANEEENADTESGEESNDDAEESVVYEYEVEQDIYEYLTTNGDQSAHIDFDSVNELLKAFIGTARLDTFAIDGTITLSINLGITTVELPIELHLRIDLDGTDSDTIYVSAMIVRSESSLYADKGGYGYIFYNGETDEFVVVRDSYEDVIETEPAEEEYKYCEKCGKEVSDAQSVVCKLRGHTITTLTRTVEKEVTRTKLIRNEYTATLTKEEFLNSIQEQLFELLNLNSTTEQIITNSISSSSDEDTSDSFTAQDMMKNMQNIFTDYQFVTSDDEDNYFSLQFNFSSINSALGEMNVKIGQTVDIATDDDGNTTETTRLTYFNGDFTIASIVKMTLNADLQQSPTHGEAKNQVVNTVHWGQSA